LDFAFTVHEFQILRWWTFRESPGCDRECRASLTPPEVPRTPRMPAPQVPVGDQPADIEAQIREICLAYVRQPNTLILAVRYVWARARLLWLGVVRLWQ
jgi:hypothetical protein